MALPFHHLRGLHVWLRCDHAGTAVDGSTESVRVATIEEAGDASAPLAEEMVDAWLQSRGGAALYECPPDRCEPPGVLLADPGGALLWWRRGLDDFAELAGGRSPPPPPPPLQFGPREPAPEPVGFDGPGSLAADPAGRLWMLERGSGRVRLLARDDLRTLAIVAPPAGRTLLHVATTAQGAIAVDTLGGVWSMPYGGEWLAAEVSGEPAPGGIRPVAVAGHPAFPLGVAIYHGIDPTAGAFALVLDGPVAYAGTVPGLEQPLPVVMRPDGGLLVGELSGAPGPGETCFTEYAVSRAGLVSTGSWGVRGFDGRGLVIDPDGQPFASTHRGMRPLYRIRAQYAEAGARLETYALDAGQFAMAWHRVFIDGCVPEGTALRVEARASDDLPGTPRDPRPPTGGDWADLIAALPPVGQRAVLGSRTTDDIDGWITVLFLDRRGPSAGVPAPLLAGEPPSDGARPRGTAGSSGCGCGCGCTAECAPPALTPPASTETFEGLLPTPPGRYVWLRIHLQATRNRTPRIQGIRVTWPRPSWLDQLPAFWRADAATADRMERFLALFEGHLTEIADRVDALRFLFDAETTPGEALPWLGNWVALTFDTRIREGVRRQLLLEAIDLYRKRGTVAGLTRVCALVAEAPVQIVEGFRLRRRSGAYLGLEPVLGGATPASVLGPGLQLDGAETMDGALTEPWELALQRAHDALLARRAAVEGAPCPPEAPPDPLSEAPIAAFHRPWAHRFTAVIQRRRDEALDDLLHQLIDALKPAHTTHALCWLDEGFQLGVTTYVGVGTRLAGTTEAYAAVLGRAPLGGLTTLGHRTPGRSLGTFTGAARIGVHTNLG